ncbi:hypothetical protein Tco_0729168 [Tanacetum coccineum]|uniref:Uncharacterized protein n=1 Tax=Tanacetum coccineum TaxID=301880 RepID=A0ABQ4YQU8_9ASTR
MRQQSPPYLPEITPFIALQLRVARLEQEMSEVKNRLILLLDVWLNKSNGLSLSRIKNMTKEFEVIIKSQREQDEEKQDSTYPSGQLINFDSGSKTSMDKEQLPD